MHLITMYILNGHLVLFHGFYICLILLIWTLVCCFRKMLPSMCSVRRHTQPVRLESLNRHNVSKQYSVSVSHRMVQYVLGIARLCCCTITQHLWRKKKKKNLKKGHRECKHVEEREYLYKDDLSDRLFTSNHSHFSSTRCTAAAPL